MEASICRNLPFILAFIIFCCGAAPAHTLATVATKRPSIYFEIASPLAQIALHYAEQGEPVPAWLSGQQADGDDATETENGDLPVIGPLVASLFSDATNIKEYRVATMAGGCFWGLELAYQREPGVIATCVGYTQGLKSECYPTYSQVCGEETGHTESVMILYDPDAVTYKRLAELLFDRIPDPTTLNRVGRDRGRQYRTGMYAHSDTQLVDAQIAFDRENGTWKTSGRPVVTEVKMAKEFWPAEEVHQRYLEKGGRFGKSQSAEKGTSDENSVLWIRPLL